VAGMDFTEEQIERYSRHIILGEIGGTGQAALLSKGAFVVGAGGLGSPALLYLAAAGVGRLGVVDSDVVELSNLQRQIIHGTSDVGRPKAVSAAETLAEANPDCKVEAHQERLSVANVREMLGGYDVVLDGSDNFATRFLVADCCRFEGIPLVSAAVLGFEGQLMTVLPDGENPCYRCHIAEPPPPGLVPSCREAGVLGAVTGVMGTLQAAEAIKTLLGLGDGLSRKLLVYDALEASFRTLKRARDPECALCGPNPTVTELVDYDASCSTAQQCDTGAI